MEQYINKIINADCMDILKHLPDKCIDLVLTDPPYGIGAGDIKFANAKTANPNKYKIYKKIDWDIVPSKNIFDEIFRVSKNQIIWGGNYFVEHLKSSQCWLVWDKKTGNNTYADCELAYTSFKKPVKKLKDFGLEHTPQMVTDDCTPRRNLLQYLNGACKITAKRVI